MMPMDVATAPNNFTSLLVTLSRPRLEEIWWATDVETPVERLMRQNYFQIPNVSYVLENGSANGPKAAALPVSAQTQAQAWRATELEKVALFRSLKPGWDGYSADAPNQEALNKAEALIGYFASVPKNRRPDLTVDAFGAPSFFLEDRDIYFHLTIESEDDMCVLNWLGEKDGVDFSDEHVPFSGEQLPEKIVMLLTA